MGKTGFNTMVWSAESQEWYENRQHPEYEGSGTGSLQVTQRLGAQKSWGPDFQSPMPWISSGCWSDCPGGGPGCFGTSWSVGHESWQETQPTAPHSLPVTVPCWVMGQPTQLLMAWSWLWAGDLAMHGDEILSNIHILRYIWQNLSVNVTLIPFALWCKWNGREQGWGSIYDLSAAGRWAPWNS